MTYLKLYFADDHSIVVLSKIENEVDSDYINANYIDVSSFDN